jgi:LacI family transcriptional regulator
MPGTRISLKDVAGRVGVHPSTASRVLNPATRQMVSEELAARVLAAAEEMGYCPNPFALGLRTRRSFIVGVLTPDLTNPVFPPMFRGIEKVLAEAGFSAMLADSHIPGVRERTILDKMKSRWLDGLILATAHRKDPLVAECLAEKIPFVLINRTTDDESIPCVVNDDRSGIRQAVEHLYGLGHTKIAHITGAQNTSTGYARFEGFTESMRELGLEPEIDLIVNCETLSETEGRQAISSLLGRGKQFTAIACANDLIALGCYDVLRKRGLKCPDDISITGFNDMPFADKFDPPLTSIRIPLLEMGEKAAGLLLKLIEDPEARIKSEKVTPQLIIRQSTAKARTS